MLAEAAASTVSSMPREPERHAGEIDDLVNRRANAFGFTTETAEGALKSAAILHRLGYRVPGILLR